jgi:hypothetical protein
MNKIISLGLGVQSTALYYMSSMGELPRLDMAIFADTGAEKEATLEYLDYLLDWQKKNDGIPIYIANYINLYKDLQISKMTIIPAFYEDKDGKTGMLRRRCTSNYKIKQINKKYREVSGIGRKNYPKTEVWIGISYEEKHRMNVPKEKWKTHVYPFCGYSINSNGKTEKLDLGLIKKRSMIYEWYEKHKLPIPVKSSCVFCPFMSDFNFQTLKKESPNDFKIACEIDEIIYKKDKSRIHGTLTPLKDLIFKKTNKGFFDDKGNCTDYCDI